MDGHKNEYKDIDKQKLTIHRNIEGHGRIFFSFISQKFRSQSWYVFGL